MSADPQHCGVCGRSVYGEHGQVSCPNCGVPTRPGDFPTRVRIKVGRNGFTVGDVVFRDGVRKTVDVRCKRADGTEIVYTRRTAGVVGV